MRLILPPLPSPLSSIPNVLFAQLVELRTLYVDDEDGVRARAVLVHVRDADLAVEIAGGHGFVNLRRILHHIGAEAFHVHAFEGEGGGKSR